MPQTPRRRRGAEGFRKSAADRTLEGDSYSNALDFAKALQDLPGGPRRPESLPQGPRRPGAAGLSRVRQRRARPRVQDREREDPISESEWPGPTANDTLRKPSRSIGDRSHRFPRFRIPSTGPRPRTTWASRSGAWASGRGARGGAAAGRGGRGLPPGPRRLHPRRPPPGLGHDPEQPGPRARESGRAAGGRRGGAAAGRGGEAYRLALTVRTRDDLPQDWATTQNNLGVALWALGERQGGAEGRGGWPRRSRPTARPSPSAPATTCPSTGPRPRTTWASRSRAWASGRGAPEGRGGWPRRSRPSAWPSPSSPATTSPRTGPGPRTTWARAPEPGRAAGGREGARRLAEAVEAYRQALTVYTRDDLPQDWATTQNNLGVALWAWASGRGAPKGRGGWPRRSRPTAWPSPSTPATTSPRTGPGPRTTWASRSGPWASGRGARRGAAAGRGGRGLPPGPRRLHPRRPPPALGHDPEQPGPRAPSPGRAAGGPEGRGGWPRRSRPTARPSPSTPATTSPRTGPGPRTTWAPRSGPWASGRGARRGAAAGRGGRGLPPGPHRLHPRRPAPGLGQDPEQPGRLRSGPWASGRGARRGCGG